MKNSCKKSKLLNEEQARKNYVSVDSFNLEPFQLDTIFLLMKKKFMGMRLF